ncbi:FliM/FliN family flagellar motor switch protein [Celeribacter indicus]|uniref:Surface presentation of antigens (SPOA) protein n=1 Tax=Celeribacter indicus TaxID=1208324 RepID=A0A0B5E3U7_9RHOB|nr:FliM/FliN family flagellar motor switch protein [Celeribacter indicus]AJE47726.1 surface presentation of antigens (SPOA) protein [Celeribacter indicus]SDW15348.1 flagellar motor switch protein FliM [Celeribacter indicus]
MSDAELISAIRRKAGVGRPPPEVEPMSPAKALRLACAKAAEEVLGLVLQVTQVLEEKTALSRLPGTIPDFALLALLEGPRNACGLCVLDRNAVAAVVEQQTTGKVLRLAPEDRPPTATDAVMCSGVIDAMLAGFEGEVQHLPSPPDVAGFRFAAQLREPRSIAMAFDDVAYRLWRVTVSLGRGVREGEILFVFPCAPPVPPPAPGMQSDFTRDFQAAVMRAEARIDTVLHRLRMPLSEAMALAEGELLPLPREALSRVELRADGRFLSRARLGQLSGKRAVRLVDGPPQDARGQKEAAAGFELPAPGALPGLSGGRGAGGARPPLADLPPEELLSGDLAVSPDGMAAAMEGALRGAGEPAPGKVSAGVPTPPPG